MSRNIYQVYLDNPLSLNLSTDLIYIGQSPYGPTNDAAITFSDFGAQFQPAQNPWVDESGSSVSMVTNTGYTSDDGSNLVTFTLPTIANVGDFIEINGKGSGLWKIVYGTSQQIHFGNQSSTITSGNLASTNQFDCVRLRCITTNTIFSVVYAVGNLTVA